MSTHTHTLRSQFAPAGVPRHVSEKASRQTHLFFTLSQGHVLIAFRERGEREGGERERDIREIEKHQSAASPPHTLTGDQTHDLLVYETGLQPNEQHQPGPDRQFLQREERARTLRPCLFVATL